MNKESDYLYILILSSLGLILTLSLLVMADNIYLQAVSAALFFICLGSLMALLCVLIENSSKKRRSSKKTIQVPTEVKMKRKDGSIVIFKAKKIFPASSKRRKTSEDKK
jgi:hypothetical protein